MDWLKEKYLVLAAGKHVPFQIETNSFLLLFLNQLLCPQSLPALSAMPIRKTMAIARG